MRLTVGQLRRIIKEEIENLHEIRPDYRIGGPRDSYGGGGSTSREDYIDSRIRNHGDRNGDDFSGMHSHDIARIAGNDYDLASAKRSLGSSSNDAALRARAKDSILYGGGNPSEENIIKTMAWLKSVGG